VRNSHRLLPSTYVMLALVLSGPAYSGTDSLPRVAQMQSVVPGSGIDFSTLRRSSFTAESTCNGERVWRREGADCTAARVAQPEALAPSSAPSGAENLPSTLNYRSPSFTTGGFSMDAGITLRFEARDHHAPGIGPTAEESSAQVNVANDLGAATLFGEFGYRLRHPYAEANLANSYFASLGTAYRLSPRVSLEFAGNYSQPTSPGALPTADFTVSSSYRRSEHVSLDVYLFKAYVASSDWGAGFNLVARY
jgi:hypothetical protein